MKKKVMILLCSAMMVLGAAVPAMAAVSPKGTPIPENTTNTTSTAPKTGEGNLALYSLAGTLLLGSAAVFSGKKLKKA